LGSIAGGSAHKFGLFQRADNETWVTGAAQNAVEIGEDEAIALVTQQRDELLAAWEVVDALPDDLGDSAWSDLEASIAEAAPTIHQLAFVHKTLKLWHPDCVDDYHSAAIQRHVLACLGVVVSGGGLYDATPAFVALLRRLRQNIPDLAMGHVSSLLNRRYGSPRGHWRIGTSTGDRDLWPTMRDRDLVAIGWDELGDLGDLVGGQRSGDARTSLYEGLRARWPDQYHPSLGRAARQLRDFFLKIQEGDLVYAARGQTILAVGQVTGGYRFEADAALFKHRRTVRWLHPEPLLEPVRTGLNTTVTNVGSNYALQAMARRALANPPPDISTPRPDTTRSSVVRAPGPIELQVDRKGQAILYGPPGTGKTYHALLTAQNMVAHDVFERPWSALTTEQKQGLEKHPERRRIWMCTFHPAYGYEDFVEGLRPIHEGGQLSFAPRPGLFLDICERARRQPAHRFVLIIDEFNRGDAPRIFGELLTLLELDKRDKAPVDLPVSKTSFTIPRNVRILATMNTADRSIAHIDAALRRRFGFIEFLPDPSVLAALHVEGLPLDALLEVLNERLLNTLGDAARNLQVGHAYLMNARNLRTFRAAFAYDLLPLLQEYCADDPRLLRSLLGPDLYDVGARRVRADVIAEGQETALIAALRDWEPDRLSPESTTEPDDEADEHEDQDEGG
ncbi:MAG: AAA family ATPase, partial [Myxococcota bacterium]